MRQGCARACPPCPYDSRRRFWWLRRGRRSHGLAASFALILLLAIFSVHGVRADGLERLKYNNPGLTVDLGVGLWAFPLPMDFDGDGKFDLVVDCPDKPYHGTYVFAKAKPMRTASAMRASCCWPTRTPPKGAGAIRGSRGPRTRASRPWSGCGASAWSTGWSGRSNPRIPNACICANSTARPRRSSSRKAAGLRPKAVPGGRSGCWRHGSWNWRSWRRFATRRCAGR